MAVEDAHKETLAAVDRIQASGVLGTSERSINLLRYLVIEELLGRGDKLRAYSIAIDVFDKKEDFDPSSNSLVRVETLRLRNGLERYYDTLGQNDSIQIELSPGSYRPNFVRMPKHQGSAPDALASIKPKFRFSKYKNLWIMATIAAVALLLITILFVSPAAERSLIGKNEAQCRSARPYLTLTFNDPYKRHTAIMKEWELTIRRYFGYYSRVNQSASKAAECPGVPTYNLEFSSPEREGQTIFATLTTEGGALIWSKSYSDSQIVTENGENRTLAAIAFELGFARGIITTDALGRNWRLKSAKEEFQCTERAHRFFDFDIEGDLIFALKCLKEAIDGGTRAADVFGLYAALQDFIVRGEVSGDTVAAKSELTKALRLENSDDPFNSELLAVRLRVARYNYPEDYLTTLEIMDSIEERYPMEPYLLNQAAWSSVVLGEYDEAVKYAERSEAIAGPVSSSYWPKIVSYSVKGEWDKTLPYIEKLKARDWKLHALLLLAIAAHFDDEESRQFALNKLEDEGLFTKSQILEEISLLAYHRSFRDVLSAGTVEALK